MENVKVVLHVMASAGELYGSGGVVHRKLEEMTCLKIHLVSFYGVYLYGAVLESFFV
jgi:hypothetical protein